MATMAVVSGQEVIDRAMSFPMEHIIDRYMRDFDVPLDVALEHEKELKRYLTLCALRPDVSYGMKGAVDDLWHTFVLFTRDYAAFCDEVAGHFIHHVPVTPGAVIGPTTGGYGRMLADYETVFGEEPPQEHWPRASGQECGSTGGSSCGGSCSPSSGECNNCTNGGSGGDSD